MSMLFPLYFIYDLAKFINGCISPKSAALIALRYVVRWSPCCTKFAAPQL